MTDLDLTGNDAASKEPKKPGRGRPTNETKSRELRNEIRDSVRELADWFGEDAQEEPEDVGAMIRQRSDAIADVLVVWAEKSDAVEKIVRKVVGKGGPLSAARAFGPIVRRLVGAARERRAQMYVEAEQPVEEHGDDFAAHS